MYKIIMRKQVSNDSDNMGGLRRLRRMGKAGEDMSSKLVLAV